MHRLISQEINRLNSLYRSPLILLINCEEIIPLLSEFCKPTPIFQLSSEPSIYKRQEHYFAGGVLSSTLRTFVLDFLCIRLSPGIITEIIIILSKPMLEPNSYLSVFIDHYLKGNDVFFYI